MPSNAAAKTRTRGRRNTNPPSARGPICASAAGLLTRGSLPRRLPGSKASGTPAGEHLPSQRRDRPGLAPGSLTVLSFGGRAYHRTVPPAPLAIDLDGALGDT